MFKLPWNRKFLIFRGISSKGPSKGKGFGGGKGIEKFKDAILQITRII